MVWYCKLSMWQKQFKYTDSMSNNSFFQFFDEIHWNLLSSKCCNPLNYFMVAMININPYRANVLCTSKNTQAIQIQIRNQWYSQCYRTGLDPDSIRSVDPDPDMESGSGSGGTKNADWVYRWAVSNIYIDLQEFTHCFATVALHLQKLIVARIKAQYSKWVRMWAMTSWRRFWISQRWAAPYTRHPSGHDNTQPWQVAEPPVCHYGSNEPTLASQFEWSVNTFIYVSKSNKEK